MKKLSLPIITAGLLIWAQSASAGPVGIRAVDVVNNVTVTCFDEQACDGLPGVIGAVTLLTTPGQLGDWDITVTTGLGYPAIPGSSPSNLRVDLNSVTVLNNNGGTLQLFLTQSDYIESGTHLYTTHLGGTTNGTISYQTFMDDKNDTIFNGGFINLVDACSDLVTSIGPQGPGSFGISQTGAFTSGGHPDPLCASGAGFYSITTMATITHSSGESLTSFDAETRQVPEPSTMILVGLGAAALGWRGRRKQK